MVSKNTSTLGENFKNYLFLLLLFLLFFLTYLSNFKIVGSGDTILSRYIPYNIYFYQRIDVTNFKFFHNKNVWFLKKKGNKIFSKYPPGSYYLLYPFVFFSEKIYSNSIFPDKTSYPVENLSWNFNFLWPIKIAAAFYTALGNIFLFLFLKKYFSLNIAFYTTITVGLGTSIISILAQDMWQHTGSYFLISLTLYFLSQEKIFFYILGLITLLVNGLWVRPTVLIFFPFLFFFPHKSDYNFSRNSKKYVFIILLVIIISGLIILKFYFSYLIKFFIILKKNFYFPIWYGISGLLFSPSYGFFILSPFLIFALTGGLLGPTSQQKEKIKLISYYSITSYLIFYGMNQVWTGGWAGGGYRYLTESLPFWAYLLALFWEKILLQSHFILKLTFIITILFGIYTNVTLFYFNDYSWHKKQIKSPSGKYPLNWKKILPNFKEESLLITDKTFLNKIKNGPLDYGHYDRRWVWNWKETMWKFYSKYWLTRHNWQKYEKKIIFLMFFWIVGIFLFYYFFVTKLRK